MKVILASGSPRRKELLHYIFDDFEIIPSGADETVPAGLDNRDVPKYLARIKAEDVANNHKDALVIGSDTVVLADGEILGKPKDIDDAKRMLYALSGKRHEVVTGCAIIMGERAASFTSVTEVYFYELTDGEIDDYVATGEPMDKAGAYGIQGYGSALVKKINGDYFTVMGLPVARLKREIEKMMNE